MKVIGHRGARGLAPENTIASFKKALEHNVDAIECDVHLTADGIPVLHHDHEFIDPSGDKVALKDVTYQELLHHKPDLATFEEALAFVNGRVELFVEIKERVPVEKIGDMLEAYRSAGHAVRVLSFDFNVLKSVKKLYPEMTLVVNEDWSGVRAAHRARKLGTKKVQLNVKSLWTGYVYSVYKAGYELAPYTVNDPKKIKRYQKYLYGVITDYPDLF